MTAGGQKERSVPSAVATETTTEYLLRRQSKAANKRLDERVFISLLWYVILQWSYHYGNGDKGDIGDAALRFR